MHDRQRVPTAEQHPAFLPEQSKGRRIVVLLQTQSEPAGAQEVSRLLGEHLSEAGYQVHHAFLYRKTASADDLPNVFFASQSRPSGVTDVLRTFGATLRYLRSLKPSSIICFQHYGSAVGAVLARLAGVPTVIANRSTAAALIPNWIVPLEVAFGSTGIYSHIVVNSAATEAECSHYPRSYRTRLRRIDHGVDIKSSSLDRNAARRLFDLPGGRLIGTTGRLHREKNISAVLPALAMLPDVHFAVAGEGDERHQLVAAAAQHGCLDRLHLVGAIAPSCVGDFLRALDVFVFPTRMETFGMSGVEAATAKVPVVANDLPVLREVLRTYDGRPCAHFVDVADTQALADSLRMALYDLPFRARLIETGPELAKKYSVEEMALQYMRLM